MSDDAKQTDGINCGVWVIIDFPTKITKDGSHYLFDLNFMEVMLAVLSLIIRAFKLFNDFNDQHIDDLLEGDNQQLDVDRYQEISLLVNEKKSKKKIEKTNIQKLLSMSDTEYSAKGSY